MSNVAHALGGACGKHRACGLSFPKSATRCATRAFAHGWKGVGSFGSEAGRSLAMLPAPTGMPRWTSMHPKAALASSQGRFSASQSPERSGVPSASFGAGASKFGVPAGVIGTPLDWTRHCAGSVTPTQTTMPAVTARSSCACVHIALFLWILTGIASLASRRCAHSYTPRMWTMAHFFGFLRRADRATAADSRPSSPPANRRVVRLRLISCGLSPSPGSVSAPASDRHLLRDRVDRGWILAQTECVQELVNHDDLGGRAILQKPISELCRPHRRMSGKPVWVTVSGGGDCRLHS